jgi:hypothetical protein
MESKCVKCTVTILIELHEAPFPCSLKSLAGLTLSLCVKCEGEASNRMCASCFKVSRRRRRLVGGSEPMTL